MPPAAMASNRPLLIGGLALAGVLAAAGCSSSGDAAGAPPPSSPPAASVSPSPTTTPPDARELASRAARAAYLGFLADIAAVVNSTRSDTDPRLARHAGTTGTALAASSVEHFVANHFAIRGQNRVDHWRVASFYPRSGTPTALTATACVDSSQGRVYDVRTGKEQAPLPGRQRIPVTVRVQLDGRAWKVIDAKSDFTKTC